jgi:hypothetical protein
LLAGFTGTSILGEMHAFRARDPRTDDIGEGMSPVQVRKCDSCVRTSLTLPTSNTLTFVLSNIQTSNILPTSFKMHLQYFEYTMNHHSSITAGQ